MEFLNPSDNIINNYTKQKIGDRYQILFQLGQGGSAITYAAKDLQTARQVAIKILSLNRLDDWKKIELFEREAKILQQLNHPAIPKYIDYFQIETEGDRFFYLVQQLAPGKSLATLIEEGWRPEEGIIKQITQQLLEILVYLQKLTPPVIHRDIKPENIILNTQDLSLGKVNLFLVDFGAVQDTYHHTVRGSTVVGTHGYMAPEQFRGQAFLSTDLYGLGTTLIFLLTGKSPLALSQRRLKLNFRPLIKSFSKQFVSWIERLIEPDERDRFPNAESALVVFQNPKSLKNYFNLTPKRPSYTSIRLTKTDDLLKITIPSALFRQRCDYLSLCHLFIGLIYPFLLLSITFVFTTNKPIYLINCLVFTSIYFNYIRLLISTEKTKEKTIWNILYAFFTKLTILIYTALVLMTLLSDMSSLLLNVPYLPFNQSLSIIIMIFGVVFLFSQLIKIESIKDLLFTTNLEISHNKYSEQLIISIKIFKLNELNQDLNFLKRQFKNKSLGSFLTKAEKSWLLDEIERWSKNERN